MKLTDTKVITLSGTKVHATLNQLADIATLQACRNGGAATIHDYKAGDRETGTSKSSAWIKAPVRTIQFISKALVQNLYNRTIAAYNGISYGDVADYVASDPVLAAMSHTELVAQFEECKALTIGSMEKTLSGDRSDAHRQGHDRCYIAIEGGIKVHLVTKRGEDKKMHPVTDSDGIPTVASIMVNAFFLNATTTVEGIPYVKNSGAKVRMDNVISRAFGQTGLNLKTLKLGEDNFSKLVIDRQVIESVQYQELIG